MSSQNLLQNVYLFKELTPEELSKVNEIAESQSYIPGDEIFSEGDDPHSIHVIRHGSVKIMRKGKQDSEINVATLGTGSHFGEMPFIDNEKRSATVTAIEPTEIINIDYERMNQLLNKNPTIAVKVYKALAHFLSGRLRITTTDLSFAREKNLRHF